MQLTYAITLLVNHVKNFNYIRILSVDTWINKVVTPKDLDILLAIWNYKFKTSSKRFKEALKKKLQFDIGGKASTKLATTLVRNLLAHSIFELFSNTLIWLKPQLVSHFYVKVCPHLSVAHFIVLLAKYPHIQNGW